MKKDSIVDDTCEGIFLLCILGSVLGFILYCSILDVNVFGIVFCALSLIAIISAIAYSIHSIKKRQIAYYSDLLEEYNDVLQNYDELKNADYTLQPKKHYEQNCLECKNKLFELTAKGEDLEKLKEHELKQEQFNKL